MEKYMCKEVVSVYNLGKKNKFSLIFVKEFSFLRTFLEKP